MFLLQAATYVGADGVLQRSEPFADQAVVFRLDEKLGALPSLQLRRDPTALETALDLDIISSWMPHLYNVLLAGLVLRRPLHGAASQVHGKLWFGLIASKLNRRRRNKLPMHVKRRRGCSERCRAPAGRKWSHDSVRHQP